MNGPYLLLEVSVTATYTVSVPTGLNTQLSLHKHNDINLLICIEAYVIKQNISKHKVNATNFYFTCSCDLIEVGVIQC